MKMRILMLGDIVGSIGRRFLKNNLSKFCASLGVNVVIANGENAANGSGITKDCAAEIIAAGVDAITLGDHTWGQKQIFGEISSLRNVVRPANYAPECPGCGWRLINTDFLNFAIINLQGRVFMNPVDCPFHTLDRVLAEIPKNVPIFVDFHAEATSEKITFAHYADGRVTAVVGTHTHVQTSDARLLPNGTAFITDLGMTGPYLSSIGRDLKAVTRNFLTGMRTHYDVADGPCVIEGAVIEIDTSTNRAISITAVRHREE